MQDNNPYAAPSANLRGKDSYGEAVGGVTSGVVDQLARTKGWTRFSGILLLVWAVAIVIFALVYMPMIFYSVRMGMVPFVLYAVVAVYVAIAVLYFVLGVKLNGFSSAIQRLLMSGKESDLEDALDRQRRFWLFCGVLTIIGIVLGGLVLLSMA